MGWLKEAKKGKNGLFCQFFVLLKNDNNDKMEVGNRRDKCKDSII